MQSDLREISKFSFWRLNCHFWEKIIKMITRINFQILIQPIYEFRWFSENIPMMTIYAKNLKIIYMASSLNSRNSSLLSFLRFSLKKWPFCLTMKIMKFLRVYSIFIATLWKSLLGPGIGVHIICNILFKN